jgi:hypothetical protein
LQPEGIIAYHLRIGLYLLPEEIMQKELIDLLRYRAVATSELKDAEAFEKAVDEIERLQARLEVTPDHPFDGIDFRDQAIAMRVERITALEAENAELRAERSNELKERLDALSDDQRLELFGRYCAHCGCKQSESGMRCQCWNDE